MAMNADVTVCIPARLKSSRFPGKVLADLGGKPVLQRVFERVRSVCDAEGVIVLCDSEVVYDAAEAFGAHAVYTSESCTSGTERIASALDKIHGEFIVNVQGDEPFFDASVIGKMVSKCQTSNASIFTPVYKCVNMRDALDPSCVKVVLDHGGRALYFSRSVIPFVRDVEDIGEWLKHSELHCHVGVYGYRRKVLENYHNLVPGKLEYAEKLKQLRFLENGYAIDTVGTSQPSIGIDTPGDLARANAAISSE
ncbi:MAG: 3-deoxy-manno-octulosonate cytidylyltransferase [Puniceicoccales bacterium]|jgi:3-deoxy-manno-octulosonate cytidylyltransferase (CMP-KDO synthetase)|nr:3-deoxy-manno-octulosonate cytidylyltransferase [Puniceicoccales bacterium]